MLSVGRCSLAAGLALARFGRRRGGRMECADGVRRRPLPGRQPHEAARGSGLAFSAGTDTGCHAAAHRPNDERAAAASCRRGLPDPADACDRRAARTRHWDARRAVAGLAYHKHDYACDGCGSWERAARGQAFFWRC